MPRKHSFEDQLPGRLKPVVCVGKTAGGHRLWECVCTCGNTCVVAAYKLKSGHTRSCGCLQKETASEIGKAAATHGKTGSPEYYVWHGMKSRCYREDDPGYHRYGGRGITVCDRWLESFENFYADMGDKPSSEYSLDRIDVNGPYSPENCRWATVEQQANNKRSNVVLTSNGKSQTGAQWARELGIPLATLQWRLHNGWEVSRALHQKVRQKNG